MDFATQVRETKNKVLSRSEYAEPIAFFNSKVEEYNKEQQLKKVAQNKSEKDFTEDLEK